MKELNPIFRRFVVQGTIAHYLYEYNDGIRSALFQLKGCYDIELSSIFFNYQSSFLHMKYRGFTMICAPSSPDSDYVRGFNHVVEMFRLIDLPIVSAINKTSPVKQADLDYEERQKIGDVLEWKCDVDIKGKKILLVDDVYTTGATIKACLHLVKQHHPRKVEILVMSKTAKIGSGR